jgi:hypothetical protein
MAKSLIKQTIAILLLTSTVGMNAADFPQAEISSRFLKAKLYLPDEKQGYYRGSRFDWSGVIESLNYKGHEYFGVWFPKYDPTLHDAITGPVEEFRGSDEGGLGFNEAKPGGMFVKIGVGVLRKPDDKPYSFARSYQIVNPGTRVVRPHADSVDFEHELNDGEGYAYKYKKTVRLAPKLPQLIIEHSLKNTGKRVIDTAVYNHDFFMVDKEQTGPDMRVQFTFAPKPDADWKGNAEIKGNDIVYLHPLEKGQSVAGPITGYGSGADANDFRVENLKTGAGVRETGNQPMSQLYFWSIPTTICPEAYIKVHVEPGQTFKWRIVYEFYLTGAKTNETGEGVW